MLQEDKNKLKDLLMNYPVKDLVQTLHLVALEVADECSDAGAKEMARDLVCLSVTLEDVADGKLFQF